MDDTTMMTGAESTDFDTMSAYREVYEDTLYFINGITSEYEFYPGILEMFRNGNMSVELKKKYIFKAIDEMWVKTIEDSLLALDQIIRNPSRFIEQQEKVLPIELSHNITSRSIVHLSQHTDYINKVEGDMITPSKILNVFNEETMQTYENKFVNTLINRLLGFVSKRYDNMKKNGKSEKNTLLRFSGDFRHGESKGRLNFEIELSEVPDATNCADVPAGCSGDLYDRVERLYHITLNYASSEFVKNMGKSYVSPPVMRTNAILKNKNLRQCLALWEFIGSYEDTGYGVSVREDLETADESYIQDLYSTCALQYLIFRYKIKNDFEEDRTLASEKTDAPLMPKFVTDIKPFSADDYNVFDSQYMRVVPYRKLSSQKRMSQSERRIAHAMDVALAADLIYDSMRDADKLAYLESLKAPPEIEEEIEEFETETVTGYKKRRLGRKRKKKIRRRAEIKAEAEDVKISAVFDYEEYMRYLNS